jgi:hypothetical protein
MPAAALSAAGSGAAGAKAAKYGGVPEAEFTTVAELLGADADDEDFCPTCLEAYSNGAQEQLLWVLLQLQNVYDSWAV